jgi:hypothetical protein
MAVTTTRWRRRPEENEQSSDSGERSSRPCVAVSCKKWYPQSHS